MNLKGRITAALAATAIAPVLALGAAGAAHADDLNILILPAVQYDPNNPRPAVHVGQGASIDVEGCAVGKTVTITANLNGKEIRTGQYNANAWGVNAEGKDVYVANTPELTETGELTAHVTCTTPDGRSVAASKTVTVKAKQGSTSEKDSEGEKDSEKSDKSMKKMPKTGN